MIFGDVQSFEIVEVCLNFGTLFDLKSQPHENGGDLLHHLSYRVQGSGGFSSSREGGVKGFVLRGLTTGGLAKRAFLFFQQAFDILLEVVDEFTQLSRFLRGSLAQIFHEGLNTAFFSEKIYAELLERFGGRSRTDAGIEVLPVLFNGFNHVQLGGGAGG